MDLTYYPSIFICPRRHTASVTSDAFYVARNLPSIYFLISLVISEESLDISLPGRGDTQYVR